MTDHSDPGTGTPAPTPWSDALDEIVASLDALERAAEQGELPADPPTWEPPAGLGPLPEELKERAASVLSALQSAIHRAATQRKVLGRELDDLERRRQAGTAYHQRSATG